MSQYDAGDERHPLALALHDDPGGHRLHAARRQLRHDLLPQHGGDLVAVEAVEDAAGLLGVDQVLVEVAQVLHGRADRRLGDLVEDHPAHRDLRLERLQQVPGDGLALAVGVGGEQELVDRLQRVLELGDLALLLRRDDVERGELVVDVDARAGPTTRPCTWPARRPRRAAGRGCARPRPRRRSPCRGTAAIFLALVPDSTITSRRVGRPFAVAGGRAGTPAAAGLAAAARAVVGRGLRTRRSGCHLVLLHRLRTCRRTLVLGTRTRRARSRRAGCTGARTPSMRGRGTGSSPEPHVRTPTRRVTPVTSSCGTGRGRSPCRPAPRERNQPVKTPFAAPVPRPVGRRRRPAGPARPARPAARSRRVPLIRSAGPRPTRAGGRPARVAAAISGRCVSGACGSSASR